MGTTIRGYRAAVAALLLGAVGVSLTPNANAFATYSSTAEFALTLESVTDVAGAPVAAGWSVDFNGFIFDMNAIATGDAFALAQTTAPSVGSMQVGDTLDESSHSQGDATNGTAESFAFTGLDINVFNSSPEDLTFTFSYTASVAASVSTDSPGDDAFAYAFVDVLDDLGLIDILLRVEADALLGPLDDSDGVVDTVSFTLAPDDSNVISASFLDSYGFAQSSAVPEPATFALLALGLAGLGSARRCGPARR